MIVHSHEHWGRQVISPEGEMLVPFWIQVPVLDVTAILERAAFELDIRVTTP